MTLGLIHGRLANTVLLYVLILGVWAFWRYFRKQGVDSSFWGALVIAEILILLQGGMGIVLWVMSLRPERGAVHILYGVVSAISLPAVFIFTRGRDERREILVYGGVLMFLVGISIRAMATGG
jgi:heme A synthase